MSSYGDVLPVCLWKFHQAIFAVLFCHPKTSQPPVARTGVIAMPDVVRIQQLESSGEVSRGFGMNASINPIENVQLGMDQYLLIPFLVGWTSIYQLFWGSLGTRVLTHPQLNGVVPIYGKSLGMVCGKTSPGALLFGRYRKTPSIVRNRATAGFPHCYWWYHLTLAKSPLHDVFWPNNSHELSIPYWIIPWVFKVFIPSPGWFQKIPLSFDYLSRTPVYLI